MPDETRILILEDEPDHAEMVVAVLRHAGLDFVHRVAANEEEYREAVAESPDLVLADFRLPDFDALEALKIRNELKVDVPVIVVTGRGEDDAIECIRAGADDYILKDRMARLPFAVETALEKAEIRRRAEARTKSETLLKARYRVLFEEGLAGHYVTTPEGRIIRCNTAMADMFGFGSVEEARQESAAGLYADAAARKDWIERIRGNRRVPPSEHTLRRVDGSPIHVLEAAVGIFDENDSLVEIHGHLMDITERKRAEEERDRLATAMEQAAEAVTITDPDGTIRWVNPAFEKMSGYSRREVLGKDPSLHGSGEHEASFFEDLWSTIARGEKWSGVITNRRQDGARYPADTTISAVRDAEGEISGYLAFQKDVSREVALERHLQEMQKMEAVGQVAGGIAHDFNNVLTVIQVNSELLRDHVPSDDLEGRELVNELLIRSRSGRELIDKLMTFGRRDELSLGELDLWQVVAELEPVLKRLLPEHIRVEVAAEPPGPTVKADAGAIEQILMNLATNARDAMPRGGTFRIDSRQLRIVEEDLEMHPWATPGTFAVISATDDGVGMDAETRTRAFEPFYTTKEPGRGTGLGMAVTYGLMKSHSGLVTLYSEEDRGTTVKLYFPVREDGARRKRAAPGPDEGIPSGSETILVVEDDDGLRRGARRSLEHLGYEVVTAADGEIALELLGARTDIDLVLTDLFMPRMGGGELLGRIRDNGSHFPVLITSGHTRDPDEYDDPQVRFLAKPWTVEELARAVRGALDD